MIEKLNEMLKGSEGSDEKIQIFNKLKKEFNNSITSLNKLSKSNMTFKIIDGEIKEIKLKHKYSNKDLKKNNIKLLKILILNILSPILSTSKYTKYFKDEEKKWEKSEKELTSKFLKDVFEVENINTDLLKIEREEKIKFIEKQEEQDSKKGVKILYANSIFQPSFEFLKEMSTTIELIESIDLELIVNQNEETRNVWTKTIFPMGKGTRHMERESHLKPTMKNLIKNIYFVDNQQFSSNINIIINMKRNLNFQEEIIIKNILKKNGVYVKSEDNNVVKSITDFDFIMLISKLKVNI